MARFFLLVVVVVGSLVGCGGDGPQCAIDTDCPLGQRCASDGTCQPVGVRLDSGAPSDAGARDGSVGEGGVDGGARDAAVDGAAGDDAGDAVDAGDDGGGAAMMMPPPAE